MKLRAVRSRTKVNAMKKGIALIFAVVMAAVTTPAFAEGVSEVDKLKGIANLIHDMKAKQKKFCEAPRSNTSTKCIADFDNAFKQMAEIAGWQAMYVLVNDGKNLPLAKMLDDEHKRATAAGVVAVQELQRLYYPLQQLGQRTQ